MNFDEIVDIVLAPGKETAVYGCALAVLGAAVLALVLTVWRFL